jgi:hypothetical protein
MAGIVHYNEARAPDLGHDFVSDTANIVLFVEANRMRPEPGDVSVRAVQCGQPRRERLANFATELGGTG